MAHRPNSNGSGHSPTPMPIYSLMASPSVMCPSPSGWRGTRRRIPGAARDVRDGRLKTKENKLFIKKYLHSLLAGPYSGCQHHLTQRKQRTENIMSKFIIIADADATQVGGIRPLVSSAPVETIEAARTQIKSHFNKLSAASREDHSVYGFAHGIDYRIIPSGAPIYTEHAGGAPYVELGDIDTLEPLEIWSGTLSERIGNSTLHKAVAKLVKV